MKVTESSLPYYFSIAGEKNKFIRFLGALTQTASSKIWTRIADSISHDNNRDAIHASWNQ